MKILIASDSHDRWENLEKAVQTAVKNECEQFLFAGDFISPTGLRYFERFKGHIRFVWGNNEGERQFLTRVIDANEHMTLHGNVMEETFGGLKFHMQHYPGEAENAALSGKYPQQNDNK